MEAAPAEFEEYSTASASYDAVRVPVGLELIARCLARSPVALGRQVLVDAGCGTGNYLLAFAGEVRRLHGIDSNPGMLEKARRKLGRRSDRTLSRGSITALPFADASVDGVMCNQVLHHLDDPDRRRTGAAGRWPHTAACIREAQRILRPGGVLVINTCSRRQLADGFWWADLIPDAMGRVARRYAPLQELAVLLRQAGLVVETELALAAPLQGAGYLDPRGPLRESWRRSDSTWSLCRPEELEKAMARLEAMLDGDRMGCYLEQREAARREVGQTTSVCARKPRPSPAGAAPGAPVRGNPA